MNHKELVHSIVLKMSLPEMEIEGMLNDAISFMVEELSEGNTIGFQGFGSFEVKKKEERLSVHPATQVRMLVPPKLVVNFKQSAVLKEKLKDLSHEER